MNHQLQILKLKEGDTIKQGAYMIECEHTAENPTTFGNMKTIETINYPNYFQEGTKLEKMTIGGVEYIYVGLNPISKGMYLTVLNHENKTFDLKKYQVQTITISPETEAYYKEMEKTISLIKEAVDNAVENGKPTITERCIKTRVNKLNKLKNKLKL